MLCYVRLGYIKKNYYSFTYFISSSLLIYNYYIVVLTYFIPGTDDRDEDGERESGEGQDGEVKANARGKRVLVVTAHPDDEVMFFGPTILHFTNHPNTTVYLLCLSTGE